MKLRLRELTRSAFIFDPFIPKTSKESSPLCTHAQLPISLYLTPHVANKSQWTAPVQHWLILFHQPIAISQRLGLKAILVTPCNPLDESL